jgi:HD-GYP domain-containing protein (c-di-GMP phosphodiesterase class II)
MKKVAVDSLKVGDIFSQPVYLDEKNVFLAAGVSLEQEAIERLKSWDIADVFTDSEIVSGPGRMQEAEAADSVEPPPKPPDEVRGGVSQELEAASYTAIATIIKQTHGLFDLIGNRLFDVKQHNWQLEAISTDLSNVVNADAISAISFVLNGTLEGYPLARNAVQTAILSELILRELSGGKGYSQNLLIGALLHDIGMLRLPKEVTEKKGQLSDLERELMQAHVVYGYQIVRQELRCNEVIGNIVLQHHERWDGEGYSQRLGSGRIDAGAKIISVADAFDAMVSEKPYRNSMTGYAAMKNLLSDNSHRFDPMALSAFVKIMGIYPVGQEVLLNDGTTARVIEARQGAPLRPLVVVTHDKQGAVTHNGPQLDLLNQPTLFIVRAVQKQK